MTLIKSILIANRGEIACRIIKTCKKLGIRSIAVYSDADQHAPHVKQADTAVHLGASSANESYLNQDKIIAAAKQTQATAIHPGYGFLAENPVFAQRCLDEGLIFIGPQPLAIAMMGSKSQAKKLMKQRGVPVIEGYQGEDQREETLCLEAQQLGFPILLKAAAGGGGKGMRIVEKEEELKSAIAAAKRESKSSFGNDELIIEKYFPEVRHIEFQIFGDTQGNIIHLLERECSIQRRHQKVIEESPSPALSPELREEMGKAAVNAAKALSYTNAGTVEFILAPDQQFYFLEINTRLQVEHPVTELITGFDLVEWQIQIAEGQTLSVKQEDIQAHGYAVECRLYAEDPNHNFLPATGQLYAWEYPEVEGIRMDTGIETGSEISIYYDPMIAKIIAHGANRQVTHRKMAYFLSHLKCLGLTTNQALLINLFNNSAINLGNYNTNFLSENPNFLSETLTNYQEHQACLAVLFHRWNAREQQRKLLANIPSGWRNNRYQAQNETFIINGLEFTVQYQQLQNQFQCTINEDDYRVVYHPISDKKLGLSINGVRNEFFIVANAQEYFVHHESHPAITVQVKDRYPVKEAEKIAGGYLTPMPGEVLKVLVDVGEEVVEGKGLITLSSMKMENTICAEQAGVVEEIFVADGQHVEAGVLLLKLES